jgi:ATP/ADP translocase
MWTAEGFAACCSRCQGPDCVCIRQVVSYGISINLVEVTWKSKIKQQFPNPNDYSAFMGDFSSATGAVTIIMMLLGRVIFRRCARTQQQPRSNMY